MDEVKEIKKLEKECEYERTLKELIGKNKNDGGKKCDEMAS